MIFCCEQTPTVDILVCLDWTRNTLTIVSRYRTVNRLTKTVILASL